MTVPAGPRPRPFLRLEKLQRCVRERCVGVKRSALHQSFGVRTRWVSSSLSAELAQTEGRWQAAAAAAAASREAAYQYVELLPYVAM